ncbi:MAG: malto-oligosyltrehalose trehalohydrolase [Planctomycetia bacterium]|nr:malto-oligosyltrehalose trehalohydrolase [Planctomycetia bacterium]
MAVGTGSACWRVWAPHAKRVDLVLYDSEGGARDSAMERLERGWFTCTREAIAEGRRYAYRLDGGPPRPDPASRWQPDGVHRPSAVFHPAAFDWDEGGWSGIARAELAIYELHVGAFTPQGTFDAIVPRLASLRELGVTAVEFMPVAQFPGERSWGYDGVHPFAVQESYGGPRALQRLVAACHRAGLAVILDVVYNHLGPEGNYLAEFGPYFTDRYRTPWGAALNFDDRGCDFVRQFVLENVRQWVRDFRIDGLRLDAVHAIYDFSPRHILAEIKEAAGDEAQRLGRPVHVIAESNLNDVRLLDPPERGGYGLDAQWSDDLHHCVHTLLTGERNGYYADFGEAEQLAKALNATFVYDGCYSPFRDRRHGAPAGNHPGDRFVVAVQNHDQVGNRALGDRFGSLLRVAPQRLAAGLLLLAPHLPLVFMGEEYGETRPFPFFCSYLDPQVAQRTRDGRRTEFAAFGWQGEIPDPQDPATFQSAKLSWSWSDDPARSGLRRLYVDLLAARKRWPVLSDFVHRRARLPTASVGRPFRAVTETTAWKGRPTDGEQGGVLELQRGLSSGELLVAYFNLGHAPVAFRPPDAPTALLLSSEWPRYGGSRHGENHAELAPCEFQIFGPAAWRIP